MKESNVVRKQGENQMNLYRLMRLQNRENTFVFRDQQLMTYLRISYQHFPLDTIPHSELLRTFWKLVSTHYFKKIDQDELYRLTYIRNLFSKNQKPALPNLLKNDRALKYLSNELGQLYSPEHLQHIYNQSEQDPSTRIWLKKMFLNIFKADKHNQKFQKACKRQMKSKHIVKPLKLMSHGKKKYKGKDSIEIHMLEEEKQMDYEIDNLGTISLIQENQNLEQQKEDIDQQIRRLEKLMDQNARQHIQFIDDLQKNIAKEDQQDGIRKSEIANHRDAQCIQRLIRNLQQKQIAQSVGKIVNCEKKDGQSRFQILFQTALNLMPQFPNQKALKKLNQMRQTSLLKFYRTGVKSTHSYICHNYAGFADLYHNRMAASRHKDKDYLQIMKKGPAPQPQIKQSMQEFDICHHCKFIYPGHMLSVCKFTSDRQSMPKISEHQTDFGQQSKIQTARVSQRFVSKHRNCLTGYAKIHEEYVCGRKFCKSCLKDNYGADWMKNNNGMCPFCQGVCSCTRCVRNEKMNKLKAFFISLGGNINKLQSQGFIEKLTIKPDELPSKLKTKAKKNYKAPKEVKTKLIKKDQGTINVATRPLIGRPRKDRQWQGVAVDQQLEKWSSTAEKQLMGWRRSVRTKTARVY